ncbi:uncharacterized protein [Musca autumnalis]|uniref:uncharacterized protein n=1 Tax=Musca autumnalis TaxID=221902 RepID=UPI003CF3F72A
MLRITILWIALATQLFSAASAGHIGTVGDHKFYVETSESYTWLEASKECLEKGMVLLSIESSEKQELLDDIADDLPSISWIGGMKINSQFEWIFKGQSFDYTNWDADEYEDEDEYCVELRMRESRYRGTWNYRNCNEYNGYICEEIPAVKEKDNEMQEELSNLKLESDNCSEGLSNLRRELVNRSNELSNLTLKLDNRSKEVSNLKLESDNQSKKLSNLRQKLEKCSATETNMKIIENMSTFEKSIKNEINRLEISMNQQFSQLPQSTSEMSLKQYIKENVSKYLKDIKEEINRQEKSLNVPIKQILDIALNLTYCRSTQSDNTNPIKTNKIHDSTETSEIAAKSSDTANANEFTKVSEKANKMSNFLFDKLFQGENMNVTYTNKNFYFQF